MKKIPYILFIACLIFAPLAFGTTEPWSLLTVEVLIALAVLFHAVQTDGVSVRVVPGLAPLLLLACWMGLQLLPLPPLVVKILSPATYQAYQPVYDMLGGNHWLPLTIYRQESFVECVRILSYICFYFLTIRLLCRGERLKQTVKVCAYLGIVIGLAAILQKFTSPDKIYWFRLITGASPVGPWVNRSQYCGFMEMVAPVILALFLYYRPTINPEEPLRVRIVSFFSASRFNLSVLMGFGFLLAASSVFVSLSRGGIIAFSLSFLFFFFVLARKKSRYSSLFYIGLIVCLILTVAWFGWDPILQRFGKTVTATGELDFDRLPIWRDSLQIVKHFWLTGSGFGTFISIFPEFKTIPGNIIYDHAHNDYIELLTDGGVIGLTLAAWFVVAVLREGWKMIGRRRDRYSILVGIGALSGIVGMLVHGLSDFNMHNGADGLYFFFLCGLLVSAGNTRLHFQGEATLLNKASWPRWRHVVIAGGVFLALVAGVQGGAMFAALQYQRVKGIYISRQLSGEKLREIFAADSLASRVDPFNGLYPFFLGEVERYQGHPGKALGYYVQAAWHDPMEGAYLQRIGMLLPKDNRRYAEVLMEKGAERTLNKDDLLLTQAQWLLGVGERAKGITVLRTAFAGNTDLVTVAIPMLQSFSFTRKEVASVLPPSGDDWARYGSYLEQTRDPEGAEFFYDRAFALFKNETKIGAEWLGRLHTFYTKQKENNKAVEVLRLGIAKLPDNAVFHILLGDHYTREGITYRAVQEYQQALLLDPNNAGVKDKLAKLTNQ